MSFSRTAEPEKFVSARVESSRDNSASEVARGALGGLEEKGLATSPPPCRAASPG